MKHKTLISSTLIVISFLIFIGCNPGREEYGLSPLIYVSETAQKNLARNLLARSFELTRMTETLQRGFAVPNPIYDSTQFHPYDSVWYARQINDSTLERVRFIPDIWRFPGQYLDSVFYGWDYSPIDTLREGTYWYRLNTKRQPPPDSLSGLSGTSTFYYRYYAVAGDGYWYNYSYYLQGTFSLSGGLPPPLDGAEFVWNGIGVSWENDGIPFRWEITGTSRRLLDGNWQIEFKMDGFDYVRAILNSDGVGTFRIGWDLFFNQHPFP